MDAMETSAHGALQEGRCLSAPQSPRRYQTRFHDFREQVTMDNKDSNKIDKKTSRKKRRVKLDAPVCTCRPVEEYRKVFKQEILTLWQEVSDFRKTCHELMVKERERFNEETSRPPSQNSVGAPPVPAVGILSRDLRTIEQNMEFLQKHQGLLNREQMLLEKEESLTARQQQLQVYEKEIEEVEQMLEKRQVLCEKRTKDVEVLNEEVLIMKKGLQSDLDTLDLLDEGIGQRQQNSPMASERAKRNWAIARRNLIDKVTMLEATVQRYRTDVASATTTITAKDMTIARLSQQISALTKDLESRDRKIKQLESQLALTVQEQQTTERQFEMLMDELQNMDFSSATYKQQSQSLSPVRNKVGRKLFKKQHSSISLFGGGSGSAGGAAIGSAALSNGDTRLRPHKSADSVRRDFSGATGSYSHRDDIIRSHGDTNGDGPLHDQADEDQEVVTSRGVSPERDVGRSKACSIM